MNMRVWVFFTLMISAVILANSCSKGLTVEENTDFDYLPGTVLSPPGNPTTPQKVALGKLLFFDPILSGNKDVACASCHHPDLGYSDNLDIAIGVNGIGLGSDRHFAIPNDIPFTRRNTPTILNTAFNGMDVYGNYNPANAPMFFDNRTHSLEEQSLKPIAALEEMRGRNISESVIIDTVIARISNISEYQRLFAEAFGPGNTITPSNLGKAIAAFERTLVTPNAPFDRYMKGDKSALTEQQKRGMLLFISNGCNDCHNGPMFSDYKTHVLGVPDNDKLDFTDKGENGTYKFRTPTLRNLKSTAPYMHNGVFATLEKVMRFYNRVKKHDHGEFRNELVPISQLDPLLKLEIVDHQDLVRFLESLSDDNFDKQVPQSVPSGLSVGGNIH